MRNKILILLIMFVFAPMQQKAQDKLASHMLKNIIDISSSYSGERLFIYGVAPPECDLVILVMSSLDSCRYSYKGKTGPLWMNMGNILFVDTPNMYKVKSTRPLSEILNPDSCKNYLIGFDALKSKIKVEGASDKNLYLEQFMQLKTEEDLYSEKEGTIEILEGNIFDASFFWPSKAKIGKYTIEVFAIRNGAVVDHRLQMVNVHKIGIEQWLTYHAQRHALMYGIVSAFIVVFLGILSALITRGVIFTLGPRKPIE